MTSVHSSTGEGTEGALWLTASNNDARPLLVLKSAVDLMSEVAVLHKNSKDELWWNERTILKRPSLVKTGNWCDKTHGGVPV